MNDVFTNPIDFSLKYAMKQYENAENDANKLIYNMLKRSQEVWNNIRIYGLQTIGMTYEQFCEQCKEKRNIMFLSDDELTMFNKAVKIMDVMKQ